jgi:hypothetical protein
LISGGQVVNKLRRMVEFSGGNGFHGCLTLCSTPWGVKESDFLGSSRELCYL